MVEQVSYPIVVIFVFGTGKLTTIDIKDDDSRSQIVRHRLAGGIDARGAPLERIASSMFMVGRHPS